VRVTDPSEPPTTAATAPPPPPPDAVTDIGADGPAVADPPASAAGTTRPSGSIGRSILSWGVTIAIAFGLTMVVKTWVFQAYSIPSESMVPTLEIDDRVLVSKLNRDPGRGDVVVFRRPANDPKTSPEDPDVLIKRVIGLPGEEVSSDSEGRVLIDGRVLEEPYLPEGTITTVGAPISVGDGQLLVLGDNRGRSQDGRYFGTIADDLVVGRAVLRIWPPSRAGGI